MSWLGMRGITAAAAGAAAALALGTAGTLPAFAAEQAYTMANYPVYAAAGDAVVAKETAHAEGQQAAFRSLLKRLVPVTAYDQIDRVKSADVARLIGGVAVRDERTSATQYIATLDYAFQPDSVRDLLSREGVPFVDEQAPELVLVPIYAPAAAGQGPVPAELSPPRGSGMWRDAWAGLDLQHALTPVKLAELKPEVTGEVVQQLINGDGSAIAELTQAYGSSLVMLAVAQPDIAGKRLNVALAGRDAVGAFVLNRSYGLNLEDVAYTSELAAVIALGILEGRWKATKLDTASGHVAGFGSDLMLVQMMVEFRNLRQWQQMQQRITRLPGLEGLQVGGLSARGAQVRAMYPGGPEALAHALAAQGFDVRHLDGGLLVGSAL